jgi:hypothetical protein
MPCFYFALYFTIRAMMPPAATPFIFRHFTPTPPRPRLRRRRHATTRCQRHCFHYCHADISRFSLSRRCFHATRLRQDALLPRHDDGPLFSLSFFRHI